MGKAEDRQRAARVKKARGTYSKMERMKSHRSTRESTHPAPRSVQSIPKPVHRILTPRSMQVVQQHNLMSEELRVKAPKSSPPSSIQSPFLRSPPLVPMISSSSNLKSPGNRSTVSKKSVKESEYVHNLKKQISFLEMECNVLKENFALGSNSAVAGSLPSSPIKSSQVATGGLTKDSLKNTLTSINLGGSIDDTITQFKARYVALELSHREQMDKLKREKQELNDNYIMAKQELNDVKTELKTVQALADDKIHSHDSDFQRQLHDYSLTKEKCKTQEIRIESLEDEIERLKQELHDTITRSEYNELHLQRDCTKFEKLSSDYSNRINDLEQEVGIIGTRVEELQIEKEQFRQDEETNTFKLETKIKEMEELTMDLARTKQDVLRLTRSLDNVKNENHDLVQELEELKLEYATAKQECDRVLKEEAAKDDNIQQLRRKCKEIMVNNDTLKMKLEFFDENLAQEKERQDEMKTQLAENIAMNAELKSQLRIAKSDLEINSKRRKNAEEDAAKYIASNQILEVYNLDANNDKLKAEESFKKLEAKNALIENELSALREELETAKDLEAIANSFKVGELKQLMSTLMSNTSRFDNFLKKHHIQEESSTRDDDDASSDYSLQDDNASHFAPDNKYNESKTR